ncbi:MAG: hypothetical protein ACRDKD_05695 [Solirubrobacteraceae bacterium]
MTAVVVGIVSLLAWAIVSDRHSKRTAGGELSPAVAPLHRNLVMPRELRAHSGARPHTARAGKAAPRSSMPA